MTDFGDLIPLRRFRGREEAEWERGHLRDAGVTALLIVGSEFDSLDDGLAEDGPFELMVPLVDVSRAVALLSREKLPPPAPEDELNGETSLQ